MGAKVQAAEMWRLRWGGSGRLVPGGRGLLPGPDLVWDLSRSPGQLSRMCLEDQDDAYGVRQKLVGEGL